MKYGRLLLFTLLAVTSIAEESLPQAYLQDPAVRDGKFVLWHDPGAVETLDFRYGIGGAALAPEPPYTFVEEDNSGTTPKVRVRDAKDHEWVIKFGEEASPDTFCTRVAWALGYYVEPTYFVGEGTVVGVHDLGRAGRVIDHDGHFRAGRFQLRSQNPKFLRYVDWAWDDNPFLGTPELSGLKIAMMLVSDWDNKDSRDADSRGTNTAIYQLGDRYYYFIDDWGGAMGHWGKYLTRSKWNPRNFADQSRNFVSAGRNGIHWGYRGQHTGLMTRDIRPSDVAWLMQYLGRITDDQLRVGLLSSGASEEQAQYYLPALRMRIRQLQQLPGASLPPEASRLAGPDR